MKSVCTWREKDGTTVGPLNCDAEISAVGIDDKVFFTVRVDLGDISTPILRSVDVDSASALAEYLQHPNKYDCPMDDIEEPTLSEDEIMTYGWFGGVLHLIIRDSVNDKMDYIIVHLRMTKNDARKLAHAINESISFLEDHGGCLADATEITKDDIRKYPKMMKQILDFYPIMERLER